MTEPGTAHDRVAVAFPGQGNKPEAVAEAVTRYRGHPLVAEFLAGQGLTGPADVDIRDTRIAQPVTYACGLAAAQEWFDSGARPPVVLGHSLGELTALAFAGVIDPADGLRLAAARGQICHAQQEAEPGSMIAVMGTDLTGIEWIRRLAVARSGGVLELAGLNGRRQTVLSGDTPTVGAAVAIAKELGVLVEVLPIGGSFHSPLMAGAVAAWRTAVDEVPFRDPATVVVSTTDAAPHTDPGELRELLVRALVLPVRWLDATKAVRALGIDLMWDAGPGETLRKLGKREHVVTFVPSPRTRMESDA